MLVERRLQLPNDLVRERLLPIKADAFYLDAQTRRQLTERERPANYEAVFCFKLFMDFPMVRVSGDLVLVCPHEEYGC